MTRFGMMLVVGTVVMSPGVAWAQQQDVPPPQAAAASSSSWRSVSRTSSWIYLADVGGITEADGAKVVRMARAPRAPESRSDREHAIETYQYRCDANQWRVVRTEEYASDGSVADAWNETDAVWLDVPPDTNMAFLKGVACDGELPTSRPWPSLEDFLASDRS